jgi:hypothetical protein
VLSPRHKILRSEVSGGRREIEEGKQKEGQGPRGTREGRKKGKEAAREEREEKKKKTC